MLSSAVWCFHTPHSHFTKTLAASQLGGEMSRDKEKRNPGAAGNGFVCRRWEKRDRQPRAHTHTHTHAGKYNNVYQVTQFCELRDVISIRRSGRARATRRAACWLCGGTAGHLCAFFVCPKYTSARTIVSSAGPINNPHAPNDRVLFLFFTAAPNVCQTNTFGWNFRFPKNEWNLFTKQSGRFQVNTRARSHSGEEEQKIVVSFTLV